VYTSDTKYRVNGVTSNNIINVQSGSINMIKIKSQESIFTIYLYPDVDAL